MTRPKFLDDIQSTTLGLAAALSGIAPKTLPYLVFVLFIWSVIFSWQNKSDAFKKLLRHPSFVLGAVFCLYAALSAMWALDPKASVKSAAVMMGLITATVFICMTTPQFLQTMSADGKIRLLRAIPIGCSIAIIYQFIDFATGNDLTRFFVLKFPELAGDHGSAFSVRQGEVIDLKPYYNNRNIAALVLLAIPFFVSTWRWLKFPKSVLYTLCMLAAFLVIVLCSESESAKLALAFGIAALCLSYVKPKFCTLGLACLFSVALLFAVPIAKIPHALSMHQLSQLPYSARDRVLIWDFTASKVTNQPILGIGARSTRRYAQNEFPKNKNVETPFTRRTAWHAHNMYLQTWFELGLAGVVILWAFGLSLFSRMHSLTPSLQPWTVGLATIGLVYASVGWGFWQTWWQGTMAIAVIGIVILDQLSNDKSENEQPV